MILSQGNLIKIQENIFQVVKIVTEEIDEGEDDEPAEPVNECQEILLCIKGSRAGKATHILKIYYNDNSIAHLMEIDRQDLENDEDDLDEAVNLINEKIIDVEDIEILY